MGKPHLDLLALAARLLEGFRTGQRTDAIAHIFVEVPGDFADDCRRALWLQRAARAVAFAGPVVDDVTLIDVACAGQLRTAWANVDIALWIEGEVGSTKGAIGAGLTCPTPECAA